MVAGFDDEASWSSEAEEGLTMLTSGGAARGTRPAALSLRCSIRACCCCFKLIIDRTCSNAFGSSPRIVNPITTGDMPLSTDGRLTSVLMLVMVIRLFLLGLGDADEDGGVWVCSGCLCGDKVAALGGGILSFSFSCLTLTVRGDRRPLDVQ